MIISQLCFWSVAIYSTNTAWKFYKSVDGRMRVLTIRLFVAISVVYTIAGTHYLLYDFSLLEQWNIFERILCSLVMLWATMGYNRHIRGK